MDNSFICHEWDLNSMTYKTKCLSHKGQLSYISILKNNDSTVYASICMVKVPYGRSTFPIVCHIAATWTISNSPNLRQSKVIQPIKVVVD